MKKTILLPLLLILFFACSKEEVITPALVGDNYEGVVRFRQLLRPGITCGINGCEPMKRINRDQDFQITFSENRYEAGVWSGKYERTEEQIRFNSVKSNCPSTIDCINPIPIKEWLDYELEDNLLTFSFTDSTATERFMEQREFVLEKQ
ncbi:MAG: hypothetical protein AB8G22_00750 [Saprospiraceae bacterium]